MPASQNEIADALITGWKGAGPILTECEARVRAGFVWEALSETSLEIDIEWEPITLPRAEPFAIPIYRLRNSRFSVHYGEESPLAYRADGVGLNEGDLFKLARACMLRATRISDPWKREEKRRFASHEKHLAFIEELLWLGRFRELKNVKRDHKLNPSESDKDVDFRFRSKSYWLNVEAKFRPGTWISKVMGSHKARGVKGLFDEVKGKFHMPALDELNLLCVTGYARADEHLSHGAVKELSEHPEITGLLYWSDDAPTGRPWSYHSITNRLAELHLSIDQEEFFRVSRVRHPVKNPKTGRPISEAAEWMEYLAGLACQ